MKNLLKQGWICVVSVNLFVAYFYDSLRTILAGYTLLCEKKKTFFRLLFKKKINKK